MDKQEARKAGDFLLERRRKKTWLRVVSLFAAIVVFCTTYVLILPAITLSNEPVCGMEEHIHGDACYDGNGALLCQLPEHTHEEACFREWDDTTPDETASGTTAPEETASGETQPGETLSVTPTRPGEPVSADTMGNETGSTSDGTLPEDTVPNETVAPTERVYTYADDTLSVTLTLPVGSEAPEDAKLRMTAIGEESEAYDALGQSIAQQLTDGRVLCAIYPFALFLEDAQGQIVSLDAPAAITVTFVQPIQEQGANPSGWAVFQGTEDGARELTGAAVEKATAENDRLVTGFAFDTASLSGVVLAELGEAETLEDSDRFTLTYSEYTITFNIQDTAGNPILGTYSNITGKGATRYIFGSKDTSTAETDQVVENIAPTIEGYTYTGAMITKEKPYSIYSLGTNDYKGTYGGSVDGFKFYTAEPLSEGQFLSWGYGDYTVTLTYTQNADNLDGRSFAIVNNTGEADALTAADNGLGSQPVTVIHTGTGYQTASDVTQWTFEKQSDGSYYIFTTVEDGREYLSLGENSALTVSKMSQKIPVTVQEEHVTLGENGIEYLLCRVESGEREHFYIAYSDALLTVNYMLRNADGTLSPLTAEHEDIVVPVGTTEEVIFTKNAPATIGNYCYVEALMDQYTVVKVNINEKNVDFLFYNAIGGYYSRSGNISVKLIYEAYPNVAGTYAIVNCTAGDYALGADFSKTEVSVASINGQNYAAGKGITEWTFAPVKQELGLYTISTQVNDETKYLYLEKGNVSLADEAKEITVAPAGGGRVALVGQDGNRLVCADGGFSAGGDSGETSEHYLMQAANGTIFYDLNLPSLASKGTGWKTEPTIGSTEQEFGDAAALFGKPAGEYKEMGPAGIAGLYRFKVGDVNGVLTNDTALPDSMKNTWYGEERFEGWEYQDSDGETHLFPAGAALTSLDDGSVQAVDADGNHVTLSSGAVLRGKWSEVSNVVSFYVNYTGTILDIEGDVAGRKGAFTLSVALGHVFYGKIRAGNDAVYATEINNQITQMFRDQFDPDDPSTQIVIECMRVCTEKPTSTTAYETAMSKEALGANSHMLESSTLELLKETGRMVQLSTSATDNRPVIDSSLCDTNHYQIRWYVIKEQTDTWHIDGVLVAKTEEIAVTKTFTGLGDEQVKSLIFYQEEASGTTQSVKPFNVSVALGGGNPQPYLEMTTNLDATGKQYEYTGKQGNIHSYHWTLHAISDEKYTLTEQNYQLEKYDCSALIVQYYTDQQGNKQIKYVSGDSTETFEVPVTGGHTTAVSFNNMYTLKGTGAFAVTKRAAGDAGILDPTLQGAEFQLVKDDDNDNAFPSVTVTTNINGTAYFNNLLEGTYTLTETKAPSGYKARIYENDKLVEWGVRVSKCEDGTIQVEVWEKDESGKEVAGTRTICYKGSIQESYVVTNEPLHNTVTVTKTFAGISLAEVEALVSENSYAIQLLPAAAAGDIAGSAREGTTNFILKLQDAQRSQDGKTFTWILDDVAETGTVQYDVVETNYLLYRDGDPQQLKYADIIVMAKVNAADATVSISRDDGRAIISSVEFHPKKHDTVEITNRYTDTFDLKLQKVDSKTADLLPGAVFDIYGPYDQSSNVGKKIQYIDDAGKQHTYYFIEQIVSGADGIAEQKGLRLSTEGATSFIYVFHESTAPSGYAADTAPKIVTVTVGQDQEGYKDGVLTLTVQNTEKAEATTTVRAEKHWIGSHSEEITMELYRTVEGSTEAKCIGTVYLDGTPEGNPNNPDAGYESEAWTAQWDGLPLYDEQGEKKYAYYIRETPLENYVTSYSGDNGALTLMELKVEDEKILAAPVNAGVLGWLVRVTNTQAYTLPETGGGGAERFFAIGIMLILAAACLYGLCIAQRSGKGGADKP